MTDQVYTVSDLSHPTYTHPNFSVEPYFCPLIYTYSETKFIDGEGEDETAITSIVD
jgi:hypothetical protein